ncbi:UDP-2,3-diacylglucosamine diphosphatase [Oligella urethralis]|uniref:UDP-2,3-diacylglucosamine diphosphatase n=1 Tax=Oligella urethralis TaxID=90245 RepID=UPI002958BBFD|nr:UDP-2,3-diacylglucosamine diphosphatase [Oligella urethralis]
MNKLSLTGTVYLASDIHLGPTIPRTNQAFYDFLAEAASAADSLILVGDIFNYWIGDDIAMHQPEPWLTEALTQLQRFAAQKPLYLIRGNRDFLIGHALAELLGARLLADQIILHVDDLAVYLSHGDELCTDDKGFMLFRAWTRQAWLQQLFFKLPLTWRLAIANKARKKSQSKQAAPNYQHQRGDVTEAAVRRVFEQHPGLHGMIHGHTHKPQQHLITLNGKSYWRVVLPDWELDQAAPRQGYAILTKDGVQLISA